MQSTTSEVIEIHKRDLKEAIFYLPPVYDTGILFSLLKTFYEEKEARRLAFQ
ncbi:MAG TPA: hypothetical protein VKA34_20840 [Balneolales bacterium]|nr:hypothetical protein [Balneolales bacterium]